MNYIQDKVQEAGAMTDIITIANVDAMYQVVAQENCNGDSGMRLMHKLTRMALVGSSRWWWGLFMFHPKLPFFNFVF